MGREHAAGQPAAVRTRTLCAGCPGAGCGGVRGLEGRGRSPLGRAGDEPHDARPRPADLVGRAEAALGAIVNGVAGELTAFKRQVHVDHGKLDALVVHLQQKFLAADGVVQELAAGTAAKFAAVDADAGRASLPCISKAPVF